MKALFDKLIFFLGWLLSPFTFWNDAFVNIPLSYIIANLLVRFLRIDFLMLVLWSYWATNALGLFLMYASGRKLIKEGRGIARELLSLIAAIAAYSILLVILHKTGVLKPV